MKQRVSERRFRTAIILVSITADIGIIGYIDEKIPKARIHQSAHRLFEAAI